MAVIEVSLQHWPIVMSMFTGPPSIKDVKHYLARADNGLARKEPFTLILDGMKINSLGAQQRKLFGDWLRTRKEDLEKYCLGQSYIMQSIIQRMILRSVFMIQKPPMPYEISPSIDASLAWCIGQFDGANVYLSDAIRELNAASWDWS